MNTRLTPARRHDISTGGSPRRRFGIDLDRNGSKKSLSIACLALAIGTALGAAAVPTALGAQEKAAERRSSTPTKATEAPQDIKASQYCSNIANAAADARFSWQKETLATLEKEIEGRIQALETKRAEYEEWLRRRNEFLAKADEGIVAIYSRMRPDAAALQLANMNDETAAAILAKLPPRTASAVLNEMEPARAAQLTNTMADTPRRPPENEKS